MENFSLRDLPPGGGTLGPNHAPPQPGGPPQLPPQMFTTAAQLLDLTDSETALLDVIRRGVRMTVGLTNVNHPVVCREVGFGTP